MENLRKLLEKVNKENPTPFDLKIVSLSNYYIGLERKRDIKNLRRLKLLVHLYPHIIEKNSFRTIQAVVENPTDKIFVIRDTNNITAIEHSLIQKHYGNIQYSVGTLKAVFKVSDLYDKFGLGDEKS